MATVPGARAGWPRTAPEWPASTLLGGLLGGSRTRLLAAGAPVRFRAGQTLLREGDRGDFVLLLVQGWFKVVAGTEHGEALLAVRTGGDLVGELGYLDRQPRAATVRAVGQGSGRRIPGPEFDALLAGDPQVATAVPRAVSQRLRWSDRRRLDVSGFPPDVRLARVLYELAAVHGRSTGAGVRIGIELTQREVAALAGVGDATAHRALTHLRRERVIGTGYRRIVILDPVRLADLSCLTAAGTGAPTLSGP